MCGRSGVKSAILSTLCPACHKQEQKHEIALRNVGSQLLLHVLWVFISNNKESSHRMTGLTPYCLWWSQVTWENSGLLIVDANEIWVCAILIVRGCWVWAYCDNEPRLKSYWFDYSYQVKICFYFKWCCYFISLHTWFVNIHVFIYWGITTININNINIKLTFMRSFCCVSNKSNLNTTIEFITFFIF